MVGSMALASNLGLAQAFLAVQSEMEAERAFGLASRHIAESSADEPQPDIEIPA